MSNVDTSPLGIERTERIAGDEALNSRLDNVAVELQGTQESVTTEVLHRSEGDLVIQRILEGYIQDLLDGKTEELERYIEFQNNQNLNYEDVREFVRSIRTSLAEEIRNLTDTLMTNLRDNDARYDKLVSDVGRYIEILSDITLDSNQITLDDGELRAGAWTILSQARQWDLDIINRLNGLSASVGDSLKDAVEELQNQLPSTEETISKAIEELSKSPQIKELSDALNSAIEDVTALDVALVKEQADRQRELAELAAQQAEALANEKALLLDRLATESQDRVDAILREATIRQQLLLDEASVRQQMLLDEAAERTAEVNAEVVARKAAIDELAEEMLTRVDLDKAEFQSSMTTVTNRIKSAEDGLTTEIQHRKDGDASNLNALNVYKVSNDSAITGLSTSLSNNVTKTNANTTLINGLTARMTTAEDGIESATTAAADAMTKATTAVTANTALSSRVDALAASITESEGTVVDVNAFNALKAEVTSVQGVVSGLTEDVTTLESNYTSVNNKVNSHGTSISTLNNKMIAAEDSISQSANDITLLKTDITSINSSLLTKVDSQAFSQLSSDVTELEGNFTTQAGLVTDLRGSLDTTNVNVSNAATAAQNAMNAAGAKGKVIFGTSAPAAADRLSQNLWIDTTGGANTPKRWNGSAWVVVTDKVATDALAAANAATTLAHTKADASAFNSLDQKVTVMDGVVSTNTNSITSLTGKISTVEGALATKLDSSAISNYYTKQQTDDKAAEIAAGKVEEFSAGLVIGGVNQLLNSEGERSSTATTRREYLLYERSAHLMNFYNEHVGNDVTVSFDLKVDAAGPVQVYSSNNSAHHYSTSVSVKAEDVGAWKRYSVTVKPKTHTASTTTSTLEFYGTYDSGRIPHVRKVQLEAGNKATDWSPSPRDTQAALDANSTAIQDVNAEVERVDGDVTAVNNATTALAGRVSTVEGAVSTKAEADALTALTTRVTNTENTNTSQGTAITTLQNAVNHSTTGLATKASTSALNLTKSDVTRIDGTVSGHTNQLTQLTADIDSINGTLATKANASALNDIYTKTQTDDKVAEIAAGKIEEFNASLKSDISDNIIIGGNSRKVRSPGSYLVASWRFKEPISEGTVVTFRYKVTYKRAEGDTVTRLTPYFQGTYSQGIATHAITSDVTSGVYEIEAVVGPGQTAVNFAFYLLTSTQSAGVGYNTEVVVEWVEGYVGTNTNLTALGGEIAANATAIQATNAEVVKVDNRVTANSDSIIGLRSSLDSVEGLIAKKADATALNNHYTKVEADDKAIEIAAGEVSKYDAKLTIGGSNLYFGPNPVVLRSQTSAGRIVFPAVASGNTQRFNYLTEDNLDLSGLQIGDPTISSIEIFVPSTDTSDYTIQFGTYRFSGPSYVYAPTVDVKTLPKDTWVKLTTAPGTYTSGQPATGINLVFNMVGRKTAGDEIRWRNFMMEKATTASSFSESYKATQAKLDANASAIETTNSEVEKVDGKTIANSDKIIGLTSRIDTAENQIALKANASALQDYYTKTEADDEATLIAAGEVSKYDASLVIGGDNLINESKSFRTGSGGSGITREILADGSLKLTGAGGTYYYWSSIASQNSIVDIKAGETYTVTLWFKAVDVTNLPTAMPHLYLVDGLSYRNTFKVLGDLSKGGEVRYVQTRTATSALVALGNPHMHFYTGALGGGLILTKWKVERGSKSSDWTPSSSEIQESISANTSAIDTLNTEVKRVDDRVTVESNRVTALTGRVDTVEGSKADVSALNALTIRVGDVEGGLANQATDTTNLTASLATTDKIAKDALPKIGGSGSFKTFKEVLNYYLATSGTNTNIVIQTPITFTANMFRISGKGYNYASTKSVIDFEVSGYAYQSTGSILQHGARNAGTFPLRIRLGMKDNKLCVILSTKGTNFAYPAFTVDAAVSYGTVSDTFKDGWSATTIAEASLASSGITAIMEPSLLDVSSELDVNAEALRTLDAQVSSIDGLVQGHVSDISNLTASIAGKADTSALNALTIRVTEEEKKSTSQATSVTNLTSKLDNMTIGGANLQPGTKEAEFSVYNGGTLSSSTGNFKTVIRKIQTDTTGTRGMSAPSGVVLKAGTEYVISFYARGQFPNYVYMMRSTATGANASLSIPQPAGFNATTFTKVVFNWTAPADRTDAYMMISRQFTTPGWFEIAELMVQEGNTPTDWQPSALDVSEEVLADYAKASAVSTLQTQVEDIDGLVNSHASQITTLTSDNADNKNTLQVQGKVINGVKANYMVKMETNGVIGGFGMIQEATGSMGTVTTTFGVNADNFFIGAPSSNKKPFIVTTSTQTINGVSYPAGTWIDVAMIANATIGTAKIDDLAVSSAKIANGAITTAKIGDLQVDTLKIKDWAVTKPFIYTSTDTSFTNAYAITHNDPVERLSVTASGFSPGALVMVSVNSDLYMTNRETGVNAGIHIPGQPLISISLNGVVSTVMCPNEFSYSYHYQNGLYISSRAASIPGTIMYTTYANANGQVTAKLLSKDGVGNIKTGTIGWISHNRTVWMMQEFKK